MSKTGVVATIFSTRFASAARLRTEAVAVVAIKQLRRDEDFPLTVNRSTDFTRQRFCPPHPDAFPFALKRRRVLAVGHDFIQYGSGQSRLLSLQIELGRLKACTRVGMAFQHLLRRGNCRRPGA